MTELLGGFAGMVRAKALKQLEPQTALLAILTFILICATWIDAWDSLQTITLDFSGLWAPILLATCYYLAAAVVFPHHSADYAQLGTYFSERKVFTVGMLLAAELLVTYSYSGVFIDWYVHKPAVFWLYEVPYNLAIKGSFVALMFVRGRRTNIALLAVLILLFMIPYWDHRAISTAISEHYGYAH